MKVFIFIILCVSVSEIFCGKLKNKLKKRSCVDSEDSTSYQQKAKFDLVSMFPGLYDDQCCHGLQCGRSLNHGTGRVVGGTVVVGRNYPWMVAIMVENKNRRSTFVCGGTLITDQHVLTAAHCIDEPILENLVMVLGVNGLTDTKDKAYTYRRAADIVIHPRFHQPINFNNDIAIITLDKKIHFTKDILPACLTDREISTKGEIGIVAGWGRLSEDGDKTTMLGQVSVPLMSTRKCTVKTAYKGNSLTKNMICAGYKNGDVDSCQGDSGGPLMIEKSTEKGEKIIEVIGIVSWGKGCARPKNPGVYTNLANYLDFVSDHTQGGCTCPRG